MNSSDLKMIEKILDTFGYELKKKETSKDKWEGVEFVMDAWGFIFKIDKKEGERFYDCNGKWESISRCSPSTEEAYVEQLKKEAFERFGEIMAGDRFDFTATGHSYHKDKEIHLNIGPKWRYKKTTDILSYYGWHIYKQGKWAERVKERIEVKFLDHVIHNKFNRFDFRISEQIYKSENLNSFLREQLENYLNDESKSV
jgi:hypothetical protein